MVEVPQTGEDSIFAHRCLRQKETLTLPPKSPSSPPPPPHPRLPTVFYSSRSRVALTLLVTSVSAHPLLMGSIHTSDSLYGGPRRRGVEVCETSAAARRGVRPSVRPTPPRPARPTSWNCFSSLQKASNARQRFSVSANSARGAITSRSREWPKLAKPVCLYIIFIHHEGRKKNNE